MSACISRHGEFSSHTLDDTHTCTLCHVLDEDALRAELTRLRAELKQWRELVDADRIERLHAEIENLHVELARLTAEWNKATRRLAELENAVTWNTSCLSCSTVLDSSLAATERAEKAEADRDRYKELFDDLVVRRRDLVGALRAANAQALRDKPVLDAAEAWVQEARRLGRADASSSSFTRELVAAVDARVADSPRETASAKKDWPEELLNARIRFWTCPDGHSERAPDAPLRQTVEWRGDVAYCLEPGCGRTSADSPREIAEPVEPTRHVDPGGEDCPRCVEIEAAAWAKHAAGDA